MGVLRIDVVIVNLKEIYGEQMIDENVKNFWLEYDKTNQLEKSKKIELQVKMINNYLLLKDENLRKFSISSLLISYYDDIIETFRKKKQDQVNEE